MAVIIKHGGTCLNCGPGSPAHAGIDQDHRHLANA